MGMLKYLHFTEYKLFGCSTIAAGICPPKFFVDLIMKHSLKASAEQIEIYEWVHNTVKNTKFYNVRKIKKPLHKF